MDAVTGTTWAINQYGAQGTDQLGKVWIAPPLPVGDDRLVFAGHVANAGTGVTVSIFHGVEVLATCLANPGFTADVPARKGVYRIEMPVREEQGRDVICSWEVVDQERQDMALAGEVPRGAPASSRPQVLFGRMGHLFLVGDAEDSVGQFARNASLSERSSTAWAELFGQMSDWQREYGLEHVSVLIAPSKEEILRDHYPFRRAVSTVFDDFMKRYGNGPVIMPRWDLWNRRQLCYRTTSTLWTDFGASVAGSTVLKRWNLPDTTPGTFKIEQSVGDLGTRLTPPTTSFGLAFAEDPTAHSVFDNGVSAHGNIRVYRNAAATIPGKLLIFGDNSGTNLAQSLSYAFQDVIHAYLPAGVDPGLIDLVRPTHLLLQISQRLVPGAPATDQSIFELGRKKLAAMSEQEREQAVARLRAAPAEFQPLVTPLFD